MESAFDLSRSQPKELSSADWCRLRPIITELYHNQQLTMNQVRLHLNMAGHRVTTRMVRARITQWNLHRNHQLKDMVAALRLLDPDTNLWPSKEPCFMIRGNTVTMKDITRFFRRKGIHDPLYWAHSTAVDHKASHVVLLNDGREWAGECTSQLEQSTRSSGAGLPVVPPCRLMQQPLTIDEIAAASLQEYCLAYIGGGHTGYQEPLVHQFTVHGQFGERMRDGLAHMMRNKPNAFPKFSAGFDLVYELLSGCHPMALGQYLAVICILATHNAHSILSHLLKFFSMMATTLRMPKAVENFLFALRSSQDVPSTAVLCLRVAVGVFTEKHAMTWQSFYMQERLCDCLYYGKAYTEGSTYRSRLFSYQETLYGPFARNVLYTLTNVASDCVNSGDIDNGHAKYMLALVRAEKLDTELGRAKIRFAALEGLAQCEQIRFEKLSYASSGAVGDLPLLRLQIASRHIQEALDLAQKRFEPTNRRRLRALERQAQIENLLTAVRQHSSSEI